jgi:hypothetical protein
MKLFQLSLLILLILVPLMAILSIVSYKLETSFDISSVKCIALIATLFNLFLSVLLLTNYDFDVLGYQFITDFSTSFATFNQSNIKVIQMIDSAALSKGEGGSLNLYNNFDYYYSQFGFKALNLIN